MPLEDRDKWRQAKREWVKNHPGILGTPGRHHSEETKRKMSLKKEGTNHWNWQGGITPQNELERRRLEYKEWRKRVFERDNYTCQICSKQKCYLNAHHIKSFSGHPNLRLNVDNGITLCDACHELITERGRWGHLFRGNKYVTAEGNKKN